MLRTFREDARRPERAIRVSVISLSRARATVPIPALRDKRLQRISVWLRARAIVAPCLAAHRPKML
jgi:hypothetical protein